MAALVGTLVTVDMRELALINRASKAWMGVQLRIVVALEVRWLCTIFGVMATAHGTRVVCVGFMVTTLVS